LMRGDERGAYISRYHVPTYREKRAEVFSWYGCRCACCGEPDIRMLSLDHIQKDECDERKVYRAIRTMWKNHEASEHYQLLCITCNQAKGPGRECPHTTEARRLFRGTL
jgi:5-methylcytosine-specific restriction endonuclease McrA